MHKILRISIQNSNFFICIFTERALASLYNSGMNMEFFKLSNYALQNGFFHKYLAKIPTYPHTYPQKQVFVWITRPFTRLITLLCICVEICIFSSSFVSTVTQSLLTISLYGFLRKTSKFRLIPSGKTKTNLYNFTLIF